MILTRDGKEVIAIYKQNGDEVDEVKDANGRLVYTNTREITGTLPLSFTSRGKPLSDYRISGNTVQDGTPTPEAPVDVVGCGVRTGNLFDKSKITTGFVYLGGVAPNASYYCSDFIPITATTYYFQNVVGGSAQNSVVVYDANKQGLRYMRLSGGVAASGAMQFQSGDAYIRINCYYATDVNTVMVNTGSTALPYEPYGYKLPLTINGTESPIYLGEAQTTRKIKKLVLTGEETFDIESSYNRFSFYIVDMLGFGVRLTKLYCTHYQNISDGRPVRDIPDNSIYTGGGSDAKKVFIKTTDYTTISAFKAYLAAQYAAGTPVTIWYVLAEQETGIANEPLMKIGGYADTITMAQAGVTIPTVSGTNVLDMSSTVKPSEVYIKGKGIRAIT
jgi:hypothetical protein